jgi:two-component sensor histidine kinase
MPNSISQPDPVDRPMAAAFANQLLLAEYIHRSANDFAVACAEAHVAGRQETLEGTRDRLDRLVERLYSLAAIQRLLQPPRAAVMDLGNELGDLCHHHAQARFAELGVFVQLRAVDVEIDSTRGWMLLMIVSELLTNAARHAFARPGGLVKVDMIRREKEIVCRVGDDGGGIRPEAARPRAGTAIVRELARTAGITMRLCQGSVGTLVELRMPLDRIY